MMFRKWAVALAAAAVFACAPASAQKISELPAATTLTGNEKVPAIQGSGCATRVAPCSNVALSTTQLATLANVSTQPLDAELTALAGQTTAANRCQYWSGTAAAALYDCTGFVRGLGTSADAAAFRSAIGLGTLATQSGTFSGTSSGTNTGDQTRTGLGAAASGANSDITSLTGLTTPLSIAQGGTGANTPAAARTALGVTQTMVFQSGVASTSVTGTTTETTFSTGTIAIPANAIGPNGTVEVFALWSVTGSTNTKTLRIKFGGTTYYSAAVSGGTIVGAHGYARISNRNSASSQVGGIGTASGLGNITSIVTSSENTASVVNVTITGQLGVSGESMALESYLVRITYGA